MSLALSNVASSAKIGGSVFGGGKAQFWLATAVTSVILFAAGFGYWSAIPLGITLTLAFRDYATCRNRAVAYNQLSDQLATSS